MTICHNVFSPTFQDVDDPLRLDSIVIALGDLIAPAHSVPGNFAPHRSKMARKRALELHIQLVFIPPYSPDLDPIESLRKSVKRIVSRTLIASEMHLKAVIERTFEEISMFNSYSTGWIRKFISKEYNKYQRLGI